MKWELYEDDECLFVGDEGDCHKAKKILVDYHKYDTSVIKVVPQHIKGCEQQYIKDVLDGKYKYGV